jgi:hypothetical protein
MFRSGSDVGANTMPVLCFGGLVRRTANDARSNLHLAALQAYVLGDSAISRIAMFSNAFSSQISYRTWTSAVNRSTETSRTGFVSLTEIP